MDIHRIDAVIVDDRTQPWTGKSNLSMRIFPLQQISMVTGGKCVFAKIVQSKQCGKSDSAHAAHQSALLGIDTIWENTFMTGQMQRFVFVRIISFLKNGYIICAAGMQIGILIRIYRIDFETDDTEIFFCNLACFTYIFHGGHGRTFSGKNQNFLQTGGGDGGHFFLNLFRCQAGTVDLIVTVETAVNAVIFTVVGNIDRCEHIDTVAKMCLCLLSGSLGDFFQKRQCSRREQCLKILRCALCMRQSTFYIRCSKLLIVVAVHGIDHLIHDIGADVLHIWQISHVINTVFLLIF